MSRRPIVAVDGPAGSGKSTTAREVARRLGYVHLDSGAVYRAVTLVAQESLAGAADGWSGAAVVRAARERGVEVLLGEGNFRVTVGGRDAEPAVRSDRVTAEVSRVSAMTEVRDFVNGLLRSASEGGGVVLDGRDIGTVVFPDAEVKVFLVADAEERARRRLREKGRATDPGIVKGEARALLNRDAHDSRREVAPLARASDAVLIDTTRLSFDAQVRRVVQLARRASQGST